MYDKLLLKRLSLDALGYFDHFCKENGLQYAITFGTELGAVRHGGFIPWDDDIDVDMPIEDYRKLEKLWNDTELYHLQTKSNELFKPTFFYQIRRNGTTWIDPGGEKIPMHWGIAIIDVFPVYHTPRNTFIRKVQQKLYALASHNCFFSWEHISAWPLQHRFHRLLALSLLFFVELISSLSKDSPYNLYPDAGIIIDRDIMFPPKELCFEGLRLFGHARPVECLTTQYGDFMTLPPESERVGHPIGIIDLENDYTNYIR